MVGGGEEERILADITVSCFKNTLFFLIFFYYMLTNGTEGGLFDVRVWVTW